MSADRGAELRALVGDLRAMRFPPDALATARTGILDCVGCIVGGAPTPAARMALEMARTECASGSAAVLGTHARLPPTLAALANGVAGHVLDYDDMSAVYLGHPSVVLVPALLALAQARRASGGMLLDAYICGFEVVSWLGRVMVPCHYQAGWHATSSLGVLGAAAASSRLLALDLDATFNALAIAASCSAGLRANFGSMAKSLHAGMAAEAGLRSALLAARGFTANAAVFSGPRGFFEAYGVNAEAAPAPAGKLEIEASGIGIKPHACCGAGVSVIDAALEVSAGRGLLLEDIESVQCTVSPMARAIMPYREARDGLQAKYCLAYCAAVALLDGIGGLAQFEDDRVRREDVQRLMQRVSVSEDPAMASGAGRFGVELVLRVRGGGTRTASLELPRGHPRRPLDPERLVGKFVECAAPVVGEARARDAARLLQRLESLDAVDPVIERLVTEESR